MMTTMAALLGHYAGARSRNRIGAAQPLGYTMVGGLIVSQALTLSPRRWCIFIWTSSAWV